MITTTKKILICLVKDFSAIHTATSLSEQLKMSRWGAWKAIKQLQMKKLVLVSPTGKGKTSTQTVHLNWSNPLTEKTLSLALAEETLSYQRWSFNFSELEKKVNFLLLYGSVLHSPKTAGDIDITSVAKKKNLSKISKLTFTVQKTQEKKIHIHNFTVQEFVLELEKPNKVFIDALKKGIILFGQERFVKFMKKFCK